MKIAHIITDLSIGGAEMMLFKILSDTDKNDSQSIVVTLMGFGKLANRIKALGIPVYSLGVKRGKIPGLLSIIKLKKILDRYSPDVVHGWMYHGNLASSIYVLIKKKEKPNVIWNIRHSIYDISKEKWLTRVIINLCKYLSFLPSRIVYNSEISAKQHEKIGYRRDKSIVIPNGFDTRKFYPDEESRKQFRNKYEIVNDEKLVGLVGRFHPLKDHANFIESASLIVNKYNKDNVKFVLVGRNIDWNNEIIASLIDKHRLKGNIYLLGECNDIPGIMAAFDVTVLSSSSEAFPNVVGESMACGVPCVVTDVGDASFIVGDTGEVVPAKNPEALAIAVIKLLEISDDERKTIGNRARKRIQDNYSIETVIEKYKNLY